MDVITVRIPELNPQSTVSLNDKIALWVAGDNKTRSATIQDLRTLILTGGTDAFPPVYSGGTVLYIVPATDAGSNIASIPSLAGKGSFLLRREGRPLIPQKNPPIAEAEFEVLNGGGFKLLQPGDELIKGERFELFIFSLVGGAPTPTPTGGSLVSGQVIVTTNITLNATDHLHKLISIRAGSNIITVTLPDIDTVPDNTIIPIETSILNSWQTTIATQGGQYIYMRNNNYTAIYMGISESLWLYRGDDGWYVINDFARNYDQVGKIQASYKIGPNEILADGSLLSRAAHPRLWESIQNLGSSLISDNAWQTPSVSYAGRTVDFPFRGCWSTGDGSTTFRVPNLMNVGLRGLLSISGIDPQRYHNVPGGYQRHEYESHNHVSAPWDKAGAKASDIDGTNSPGSVDSTNNTTEYRVAVMGAYWSAATIKAAGGAETRMDNVGVLWTIKE